MPGTTSMEGATAKSAGGVATFAAVLPSALVAAKATVAGAGAGVTELSVVALSTAL